MRTRVICVNIASIAIVGITMLGITMLGIGLVATGAVSSVWAQSRYRVAAPVKQGALTVYLVRTDSAQINHNYLTLDEAFQKQSAELHETGTTDLLLENTGERDIFVQSGQIVKGGQQDRMLAGDLIIPDGDTNTHVAAFCVEHDRSTQRGSEPLATFSEASDIAPLAAMRRAAIKPYATHALSISSAGGDGYTAPLDTSRHEHATQQEQSMQQEQTMKQQQAMLEQLSWYESQNVLQETAEQKAIQEEVWSGVKHVQENLARRLGRSVRQERSPSSLALTLEESSVHSLVDSIGGELAAKLEAQGLMEKQTVGLAYAINGVLRGYDIYGSHTLFLKQEGMLIRAAEIEAESERIAEAPTLTSESVSQEINRRPAVQPVFKDVTLRERITLWQDGAISRFETRDTEAPEAPVHISELIP